MYHIFFLHTHFVEKYTEIVLDIKLVKILVNTIRWTGQFYNSIAYCTDSLFASLAILATIDFSIETVHIDAQCQQIFLLFPHVSSATAKSEFSSRIHLYPQSSREMVEIYKDL